jgi:hypothetical protein
MPVYSRRAKKNAPERALVEVQTSGCDWEHRSSLVDDLGVRVRAPYAADYALNWPTVVPSTASCR